MFGIGGGELIFIIFIALMLFGADKIPEIARSLGKGMAQIKNATNEIKLEIQKSAEANGIDNPIKELSIDFSTEIESIKENIGTKNINPLKEVKESFNDLTGPIKRQM